jgi:hypothetical protein
MERKVKGVMPHTQLHAQNFTNGRAEMPHGKQSSGAGDDHSSISEACILHSKLTHKVICSYLKVTS